MAESVVGRVRDKVALVTGAARGQGRSHAVKLAEEGAKYVTAGVEMIEKFPEVARY